MARKNNPGSNINNKSNLVFDTNGVHIVLNFDDMGLKKQLLRGIYACGMKEPTLIQERAIIPLIQGKDVIAQAQSGMGKTAFFLIGILERVDRSLHECQALILVPTRELALQMQKVVISLSKYMQLKCRTLTGGTPLWKDIDRLEDGVHVVIGCPGRVIQMIKYDYLNTEHIKIFVLDEADKLLENRTPKPTRPRKKHNHIDDNLPVQFEYQINEIFGIKSKNAQVVLCSATFPEYMKQMAKEHLKREHVYILVKDKELTLEGIRQYYVDVGHQSKLNTLCDIFEKVSKHQTLIFCNTRDTVDKLILNMTRRGCDVWSIHGDMKQKYRDEIISEFRSGEIKVLITSDLLSRGIDVQQIEIVINYDIPEERELYIHRIGRAGRYGRTGMAISIVSGGQLDEIKQLENFYDTEIKAMPMNVMNQV